MHDFGLESEDISLDLTPIIDVVFLLLIFFIMATTFSKPVLDVMLAEASSAAVQERRENDVTLTIMADGSWVMDGKTVTSDEWNATLDGMAEDAAIVFNVDKNAPFSAFIGALDAAKSKARNSVVINAASDKAVHTRP